ncbi:MAG: hypothetical protein IPG84_07500 [Betaproteobacteria bacterium]|nr:hypothetical protein [Betaproteobacteria bacterium]
MSARALAGLIDSERVLSRFLARLPSHPRVDAIAAARIRTELEELGRDGLLPA